MTYNHTDPGDRVITEDIERLLIARIAELVADGGGETKSRAKRQLESETLKVYITSETTEPPLALESTQDVSTQLRHRT